MKVLYDIFACDKCGIMRAVVHGDDVQRQEGQCNVETFTSGAAVAYCIGYVKFLGSSWIELERTTTHGT